MCDCGCGVACTTLCVVVGLWRPSLLLGLDCVEPQTKIQSELARFCC